MTLKQSWINDCFLIAARKADFYSGCRKIIRNVTLSFPLDDSLKLSDAGYTSSKLTILTNHYLHRESRDVAVQLWKKRCEQAKYGSVSFTTFGHFVKGGSIDAKRSKRASVFGPCLQSIVITWIDKRTTGVDVFYRTTELFKKFAPDLVFIRDVLLEPFNLGRVNFKCHFANLTAHPMYAVTFLPHFPDPCKILGDLKKRDRFFHDWTVKWTARYLCPEYHRGIAKFSQALRVQADARRRIDASTLKRLQKYLRNNHPGYRGDYDANLQ